MPSEQLTVLKLDAETLDGAGLPYMVSGSTAVNYYAQPRMTRVTSTSSWSCRRTT